MVSTQDRVAVVVVQLLGCVQLFEIPWTVSRQAPWGSPGKSPGVGCHFLLQGIFPGQGSNPCLLHWQVDSLPLSHQGSPPAVALCPLVAAPGMVGLCPLITPAALHLHPSASHLPIPGATCQGLNPLRLAGSSGSKQLEVPTGTEWAWMGQHWSVLTYRRGAVSCTLTG